MAQKRHVRAQKGRYTNKRLNGHIRPISLFSFPRSLLCPFQHSLTPGIDQTGKEDEDENNTFYHSEQPKLT
jgi:hypothetical protein